MREEVMSSTVDLASVKGKVTADVFSAAEEIQKYVKEYALPAFSRGDCDGGMRLAWRDGAKEVIATIQKDGKLADYSAKGATRQARATVKSHLRWLFEPTNI
jgi:hypothetical protein